MRRKFSSTRCRFQATALTAASLHAASKVSLDPTGFQIDLHTTQRVRSSFGWTRNPARKAIFRASVNVIILFSIYSDRGMKSSQIVISFRQIFSFRLKGLLATYWAH